MPDDTVFIYTGSDAQPLQDQIKVGGRPFDLSAATSVTFNLRHSTNSDLKIAEASAVVTDDVAGKVSYNWQDSDIDEPGEYFGWWHVNFAGGDLDTSEFPVIVGQHSPGRRSHNGAIYRASRSILPITWDALERTDKYGDALLQERVEAVKLNLFGEAISVDDESTYDIRIVEFAAKLVAIQVIPAGVDYWGSQQQSFVAQGTQETASYPDRIAALWKIYERLQIQIAQDRPIIDEILDVSTLGRAITDVPDVSGGIEEGFLTPVPSDNFGPYHFRHRRRGGHGTELF
jgi:hypothetical protein